MTAVLLALAIMIGTPSDDVLLGTPQRDRISALAGDDRIRPGAGVDVVRCGAGFDVVYVRDLRDSYRNCERVRYSPP